MQVWVTEWFLATLPGYVPPERSDSLIPERYQTSKQVFRQEKRWYVFVSEMTNNVCHIFRRDSGQTFI